MHKLVRMTTIPLSLEKLLEGQLTYMSQFYDVTAVSAEKERLEKYGRDNKVKTYCVEMTRAITPLEDLKAVFSLYKFFRKERPTIVHTHTPKAGIVGMLAAKLARVPIRLHTVAGLPLLETTGAKRKLLNFVEKKTYDLASRIYPNSFGLRDIILKEGFAKSEKIKVLGKGSSNGIDLNYFSGIKPKQEEREKLLKTIGIPEEDIIFIFIGRLVSEKGINELVAAFDKLQEDYKNISLLLVGPFEEELDPLSPSSLNTIKKHKKIFSTGYQQDVRPFLSVSHILAFPSYREGFPNVVMQAGAMGLPSIVSDINGCNEIIETGKNGIIIPVKDEYALLEAMKSLIQNPAMRMELASRARIEIQENYDRGRFWRLLQEEYSTLINAVEEQS